jgi:hypothetical protein
MRLHLGIGGDSCLYCGFGADPAGLDGGIVLILQLFNETLESFAPFY